MTRGKTMPGEDVHKFLDELEANPELRKEVREARDVAIEQICEIAKKHGHGFTADELRAALHDKWEGSANFSKDGDDEDLPNLAIASEPPGF
jgi:predicted ribosomally synthesized peptide with nif11-like leader